MTTATICLRALNAISLAASTEETRYYLKGVHLEISPRAVVYVATDGHRLMCARTEIAEDAPDNTFTGSLIVPTDKCRPFKIRPTRLAQGVSADLRPMGDGQIALTCFDETVIFRPVDGSFPDWRRILPRDASGEAAHFDMAYLTSFAKFGTLMGAGRAVIAHNGLSPALVSYNTDRPDLFGVVMPIRTSPSLTSPPAWVNAPAERSIAQAA